MSIHVHRNSFNAGEISPLMDARVDENKHQFSCRILENFIPRIYGGAFRRPGTMYLGAVPEVSQWTERSEFHNPNLENAGENTIPNAFDDNVYQIGSLWVRDVAIPYTCTVSTINDAVWTQQSLRHDLYQVAPPQGSVDNLSVGFGVNSLWRIMPSGEIYKCTASTTSSATWVQVTVFSNLEATAAPTSANNSSQGFELNSLWIIASNGAVYICTNATTGSWSKIVNPVCRFEPTVYDGATQGYAIGSIAYFKTFAWKCTDPTQDAAVWEPVMLKHAIQATRKPLESDDSGDGFAEGSVWVWRTRTLYECTSAEDNAATWVAVAGTHQFNSSRSPLGSDGTDSGFGVGSVWIDAPNKRAWELTDLTVPSKTRLIDFNLSATSRRILEFSDGYLRIWYGEGSLVEDKINNPGFPLVLTTPYSGDEIFDVQIAQLGNVAYFAHPMHPPQKLVRTFDNTTFFTETFTWSEVNWSFPAFRDLNNTGVTATPSVAATGYTNISFSADPFVETSKTSDYTGARILLSQRRNNAQVKLSLENTGNSNPINVLGTYRVYTYGASKGTLDVQGKDKAGNWTTLKTFQFNADAGGRNIVYQAETTEATDIRLKFTEDGTTSAGDAYLEAEDSRRVGYARILDGIRYPFPTFLPRVPCEIELPFDSVTSTTEWAIEAWAEYAGYPRSVCFHEQRLWFGGTELQPNTLWASATNDFENFRRGSFDSDSLAFTLAAQEGSAIQSLVSHDALVIFTQAEEWTAATSEQTSITPSNIFVRRQSRFGSAHRQAFVAANNLLFLQRGSRKLRQFSYGRGGDGVASDLTLLAEHVTLGGIRQIAFQQQPDPIIWCVRNDGVLLSLTYEADQEVIAWARHTSGDGLFESVVTIYGDDGEADEVWVVVNRGGTRLVERIDSEAYAKLEEGDAERMVYLDSAILIERNPATTSVTGLSHLNGTTVQILADGAVVPSKTVASGSITLDSAAAKVVVGIPYISKLQPSKIEIAMQDGTAQGRRFICKRAALNLWKTFGLQYSDNPDAAESQWFDVEGRSTNTTYDTPSPLTTGMRQINNLGRHGDSVDLCFRQTLPLPANLLAIVPKLDVSGD
jgi:hypothetical protein